MLMPTTRRHCSPVSSNVFVMTARRGRRRDCALLDHRLAPPAIGPDISNTVGLALRQRHRQTGARDFGQPKASFSRRRVSVMPSRILPASGLGRSRWLVELIRCRAGESSNLEVARAMTPVASLFLPR